jgi:tRNA pseudouridine38-40 synthase
VRTLRGAVQYDGTAYAGFQAQPGIATVQGALEDALSRVTGTASRVIGAGRTDAGVHAREQVISFRTDSRLSTDELLRALNAVLPGDVVVQTLEEAPQGFHARYDARSRAYEYVVYNAPVPSPFWRLYSHHVAGALDCDAMNEALGALVGEHDFAAFGMPMEKTRDGVTVRGGTVRRLLAARCWMTRPFVYFYLEADAFLRHMVRQIVGTALRIGQRRLAPSAMLEILRSRRIAASGPAAPARGLYLVSVSY